MAKFIPLTGSSYIPLIPYISNKKACINIKNNDQKCFAYCILAVLYPAKNHPERVSNYTKYLNKLNLKL